MGKNAWALVAATVALALAFLGWFSLGGFFPDDLHGAAVDSRGSLTSGRLDVIYTTDISSSEAAAYKLQSDETARLGKENYVVSFADYTEADGDTDISNRSVVVPSVFAVLPSFQERAAAALSAASSHRSSSTPTYQKGGGIGRFKSPGGAGLDDRDDADGGAALATGDTGGVPLYPDSFHSYRHPFGTCGKGLNDAGTKPSILDLRYSNFTMGNGSDFVRVWPAYPDLRLAFPTEHERCHFVMARMLAIFTAVMRKFGLKTWFMSHATLLGAVRGGGFVPWDVDVDIAMPRSHITYLRRRWRREFPRDMFLQSEKTDTAFHMWNGKERAMRIKDRYSSFAGMRFSIQRGRKKYKQKRWHMGAHIDIIPMEKKNSGARYKILHHYFAAEDLFPLQDICFENMMIPAPHNTHAFLSKIYGDSYMQPPDNVTFGGPTVLPCLATQHTRGSPWSLMFSEDFKNASRPVVAPRADPYGSYESDLKTPYQLYYNSKW